MKVELTRMLLESGIAASWWRFEVFAKIIALSSSNNFKTQLQNNFTTSSNRRNEVDTEANKDLLIFFHGV